MNQYAVFPIEAAELLQCNYTIASPATWRLERREADGTIKTYAGVEEKEFTPAQLAELFSINALVFTSRDWFEIWLHLNDLTE